MQKLFQKIEENWKTNKYPIWKKISCDECKKGVRKAFHIWNKGKRKHMEFHLCRSCGAKYGLK